MLRSVVIAIGAACVVIGGVMLLFGVAGGFGPLLCGTILLLATIFERVIYKPVERARPGPGWQETPERFIDEKTGETVTVWLDPASGERKYVKG